MTYVAAADRYERMPYRRCGRSGLKLPAVSLGLWQNFGDDRPLETQRAILRRAFDLGITHFDLANNYGPPYGSAEANFGRILARGLAAVPRRAGHLDQGRLRHVAGPVRRLRLAQVPAREPRPEPRAHGPRLRRHLLLAPLRPRHAARGDDGRARHRGAAGQGAVRRDLVLLGRAHRPRRRGSCASSARRCSSTSRPTRCSTAGSRRTCSTCSSEEGVGCIVFSPLAQGMLTERTSTASPRTRAPPARRLALARHAHRREPRARPGAERRSRSAAARRWRRWRSPGCCATRGSTSALIGASSVQQLEENVGALEQPRLHRRRARRDRRARRRGRDQHLGAVERPLTVRSRTAAGRRVRRMTET